jgi:Telomere resolvase
MSQALKQKIDELFQATKDLMSLEEIKPHCEAFNEWINTQTSYKKNSLGSHLSRNGFYKLFNSIKLEQGKNAELVAKHNADGSVKGHELKHYVLQLCGLTNSDWNEINNTSRVTDRLTNEGTEIKPNEYIDVTAKLLESDDPHELAVGLIAATGRRPHEILARGKFTVIEGESYQAMFEGQGKKRGEKPIFKVHTLFPANYLIQRLRVLRKDTQSLLKEVANQYPNDITKQNAAIEDKRGNSLRRVVQEYFGGKDSKEPILNFRHGQDQNDCKALRAACSVLITAREVKGSLGSQLLFAARFLGHITETEKPTDKDLQHIATTIGYSDYFVTDPVDYPLAPEKIKTTNVKIQPEDLSRVKQLQEQWECSQHEIVARLLDRNDEVLKLQKQLIEAQNKIAELEKILNNQPMKNKEISEVLPTEQIDESNLVEVVKNLVLEVERLKNRPTATERKQPIPKDVDLSEVPSDDLKVRRSPDAVEEKINRAFQAITHHNNEIATDNSQRWYIGNTSLRELSGCNGKNVADWIEVHKGLVDDHNLKFKLGQYHNRGKGDITKVITW